MFPRLSLAEESLHLNFLSHSQGSSSFPGLLSSACSRPHHPYLSASTFGVRVWVCKHKHGHLLFSTCALCVQLMPRGCLRQEFFWPRETSDPSSRTAPQLVDCRRPPRVTSALTVRVAAESRGLPFPR